MNPEAATGVDGRPLSKRGERLAKFKVPSVVRFVDEIPRNSLGKIQKQGLVQAVTA